MIIVKCPPPGVALVYSKRIWGGPQTFKTRNLFKHPCGVLDTTEVPNPCLSVNHDSV